MSLHTQFQCIEQYAFAYDGFISVGIPAFITGRKVLPSAHIFALKMCFTTHTVNLYSWILSNVKAENRSTLGWNLEIVVG